MVTAGKSISPVTETVAPGGHVDFAFAGGGTVRLEVEVLEARLQDLGEIGRAHV